MARIQTASILLAAASATAVCASQTPGGAGNMTINGGSASGGVATLDVARRVLFTTAANDSAHTVTVTGTDRYSQPIIETVKLANTGTAYTLQDYKTVTQIAISAAATGAITVGTNGIASTAWLALDHHISAFDVGLTVNFGAATANVTVEGTVDKIDKAAVDSAPTGNGDSSAAGLATSTFVVPTALFVTGLNAITADASQGLTVPQRAVRLTVNSGATTAGVRFTVAQSGVWG